MQQHLILFTYICHVGTLKVLAYYSKGWQDPSLNPFPHTDALWCLCSRRLLKSLWQMVLHLPQWFQLYSIIDISFIEFIYILDSIICRFIVCGNGLNRLITTRLRGFPIPDLNPFPPIDAFWHVCSRRLSKTLWHLREKLLIASNFSICQNVFNYLR